MVGRILKGVVTSGVALLLLVSASGVFAQKLLEIPSIGTTYLEGSQVDCRAHMPNNPDAKFGVDWGPIECPAHPRFRGRPSSAPPGEIQLCDGVVTTWASSLSKWDPVRLNFPCEYPLPIINSASNKKTQQASPPSSGAGTCRAQHSVSTIQGALDQCRCEEGNPIVFEDTHDSWVICRAKQGGNWRCHYPDDGSAHQCSIR